MATDFAEETAADAVVDGFAGTPDPRLRELLAGLVRHLHAFVRETEPTIAEWERAIEFLTATGRKCDDERQEFILLSDVLGVSMLVETINNRTSGASTESTVLGPFHVVASPRRELGDTIDLVGTGTPCVVRGRVLSVGGTPLPGAELDVWQASGQGFYDVQQPDVQPRGNGRGLFTAGDGGAFWFRTVLPSHYPIPADAVFAVKKSLIVEFTQADDPEQIARYGLTDDESLWRPVEACMAAAPVNSWAARRAALAAFMLLETKNIVQFALLFGTTWFVNALVTAGVLLAVLAAVEVSRRVVVRRPALLYLGLLAALAVAWAVRPEWLLSLSPVPRFAAAVAIAFAPIFMANMVFAQRFRDTGDSGTAFGANLLGAMVGGILEYLSLVIGYRWLLAVVALLYGLAFITGAPR